jgi:hypothetical protein
MTTTKRRVTLRFWNNVLEKVERWTGTQYRSTRLVTPNGRYQYVEQREAKAGRRVAGLPGRAVHWIFIARLTGTEVYARYRLFLPLNSVGSGVQIGYI